MLENTLVMLQPLSR